MTVARRICIESPLRGSVTQNVAYADACMLDALRRGEAPYLGHLLYPRVLDDTRAEDRELGIAAHIAWLRLSDAVVIYTDRGVTEGMQRAIDLAHTIRIPTEYRQLGTAWSSRFSPHTTPGFFSRPGRAAPKPLTVRGSQWHEATAVQHRSTTTSQWSASYPASSTTTSYVCAAMRWRRPSSRSTD